MFKVGDFIKRKDIPIPETAPGAAGMSINTAYKIIWIAPNGLCVLENYFMLVNPEYLTRVVGNFSESNP